MAGDRQDLEIIEVERSREILGLGFSGAVRFGEMLAAEGELRGLIGPRELPRLWTRHILNCAAVAQFLPEQGAVADLGSGAGLPGVVLALMRPDLDLHLVEPMERRVEWLGAVVDELDLDNVMLHQVRAEELHGRKAFAAVPARAVAAMQKLGRIAMPLLEPGGVLLAQKGKRGQVELEEALPALKRLGASTWAVHEIDLLDDGDVTRVVQVGRR